VTTQQQQHQAPQEPNQWNSMQSINVQVTVTETTTPPACSSTSRTWTRSSSPHHHSQVKRALHRPAKTSRASFSSESMGVWSRCSSATCPASARGAQMEDEGWYTCQAVKAADSTDSKLIFSLFEYLNLCLKAVPKST
jgi:hypothetical protein